LAGALAALGCSGDPRVSAGDRFTQDVVGEPGAALIDDMEDGTQYILSDDGRIGLWYTYSDESVGSTQSPAIGFPMYRTSNEDGTPYPGAEVQPRPCGGVGTTPFFATEDSCSLVARTWGTGQRGWGAGMGVDVNGEGGVKNPFDASEYGGIGFFAWGRVRAGLLRMNIQDVRTTPESAAAADRRFVPRCESTMSTPSGEVATGRCNDHFGYTVRIASNAPADVPQWRWYEIPFDCMTSGGWGFPGVGGENAPFPEGIVGVQFQIQGPDTDDNGAPDMVNGMPQAIEPFDFAIDNLSFIEKSRVGTPPVCPALN
jgi:hypothetical protein